MQVLAYAMAAFVVTLAACLALSAKAIRGVLCALAWFIYFRARFQPETPGLPASHFTFRLGPIRPKQGVHVLIGLQNTQIGRMSAAVEPPGARIDGDPILEVMNPALAGAIFVMKVISETDQELLVFDIVTVDGAPKELTTVRIAADKKVGEGLELIEGTIDLAIVGPEATGLGFQLVSVREKETAPPA